MLQMTSSYVWDEHYSLSVDRWSIYQLFTLCSHVTLCIMSNLQLASFYYKVCIFLHIYFLNFNFLLTVT